MSFVSAPPPTAKDFHVHGQHKQYYVAANGTHYVTNDFERVVQLLSRDQRGRGWRLMQDSEVPVIITRASVIDTQTRRMLAESDDDGLSEKGKAVYAALEARIKEMLLATEDAEWLNRLKVDGRFGIPLSYFDFHALARLAIKRETDAWCAGRDAAVQYCRIQEEELNRLSAQQRADNKDSVASKLLTRAQWSLDSTQAT